MKKDVFPINYTFCLSVVVVSFSCTINGLYESNANFLEKKKFKTTRKNDEEKWKRAILEK